MVLCNHHLVTSKFAFDFYRNSFRTRFNKQVRMSDADSLFEWQLISTGFHRSAHKQVQPLRALNVHLNSIENQWNSYVAMAKTIQFSMHGNQSYYVINDGDDDIQPRSMHGICCTRRTVALTFFQSVYARTTKSPAIIFIYKYIFFPY